MANPFAPPASYQEATKMLGGTYVCPDGIERMISGAGMGGQNWSVYFGQPNKTGLCEAYWSVENGFETRAQHQLRTWDAEWQALGAEKQLLVVKVFGEVATKEERAGYKAGDVLVRAAMIKLVKSGKMEMETCSRCGGSGHFSYNQIDGRSASSATRAGSKCRPFGPLSSAPNLKPTEKPDDYFSLPGGRRL